MCERGDVLIDGLVRVVGMFAVIALLVFEVVAIGVNVVQLDELAGDVARDAARALPDAANPSVLQAVAEQHVRVSLQDRPDVQLVGVTVSPEREVGVAVERAAPTVVVRRIPLLAERVPHAVTGIGRPPLM